MAEENVLGVEQLRRQRISIRVNIGVSMVSGRYDECPLQGWRGQRENISHIFSWLCCYWFGKKKEINKDLSVPWCVPWGNSGRDMSSGW